MIYISYEVVPTPENKVFGEVGGAFARCFIKTVSKKKAKERALLNFAEQGWKVVSIEQGPFASERKRLIGNDLLVYFDHAVEDGECYVFHQWPNEPQEGD